MIRDRGRFWYILRPRNLPRCPRILPVAARFFSLFRVAMPLRATRASPLGGFGARFRGRGFFLWEATVTLDALSSMAQAFADMLAAYFNERDCSVDQSTSRLRHSLRQWAAEFGPHKMVQMTTLIPQYTIGE